MQVPGRGVRVEDYLTKLGAMTGERRVPWRSPTRSSRCSGPIDPGVAVTLALEVTFGMAKLMPMSVTAFQAVGR